MPFEVEIVQWRCFPTAIVLVATTLSGANALILRDGSFERGGKGWSLVRESRIVPVANAPHGRQALLCEGNGALAVQPFIVEPQGLYSVSLWWRVEEVRPLTGAGYAYAAIYEFDFHGHLVAFRDFAQRVGTNEWQRVTATWKVHPRAFYAEVRLGLYNANGHAWFDAVQVVKGMIAPEGFLGGGSWGAAAVDLPPLRDAAASFLAVAATVDRVASTSRLQTATGDGRAIGKTVKLQRRGGKRRFARSAKRAPLPNRSAPKFARHADAGLRLADFWRLRF